MMHVRREKMISELTMARVKVEGMEGSAKEDTHESGKILGSLSSEFADSATHAEACSNFVLLSGDHEEALCHTVSL
jgi:hypothetical protein